MLERGCYAKIFSSVTSRSQLSSHVMVEFRIKVGDLRSFLFIVYYIAFLISNKCTLCCSNSEITQ